MKKPWGFKVDEDFQPLSHPDNNNLGNIKGYTVQVDPKNMVEESNEDNSVTALCE